VGTADEGDDWLLAHADHLLGFAAGARTPAGFGWLNDTGELDRVRGVQTWITSRMTYVFAVASRRGRPELSEPAEHGLRALAGPLHDDRHGGWWGRADQTPTRKQAYEHAFVLLAAASARSAGLAGSADLLGEAMRVVEQRFWDDDAGAVRESFAADWSDVEAYRGANANMHMVEAFLATARVTGDRSWVDRAQRITRRIVHPAASTAADVLLAEHYDAHWRALPRYNEDDRADPFRPYGVTVGHLFEWARLCVQVGVALGEDAPTWLASDAERLFASAVRLGWARDGHDGFVYTVGWDGAPVITERLHWVVAEAIGAARVLGLATGRDEYAARSRDWWAYARMSFVDDVAGSWHHELDASGGPASSIWQGKPDVYHALQAIWLSCSPLDSTLVSAAVS
jgi:sulfoquinovose isomerase